MKRAQILLEEEQSRRLEELAERLGRSKSSLVREGIDLLLAEKADGIPDPLVVLIGQAGAVGSDEVSERHDEVLARTELDE